MRAGQQQALAGSLGSLGLSEKQEGTELSSVKKVVKGKDDPVRKLQARLFTEHMRNVNLEQEHKTDQAQAVAYKAQLEKYKKELHRATERLRKEREANKINAEQYEKANHALENTKLA